MNKVECYAGSTYPEKPRAIIWEGQTYQVQEVINQVREPESLLFLVLCSPGNMLFELTYNLIDKDWQIEPKGFVKNEGFSKTSPNTTGD
jgi:hypothetical protein